MTKLTAFLCGVVAWCAVAAVSVAIAFNIGDKNQVAMFLPILAAVVAAWGVGEVVTAKVFNGEEEKK